MKDSKMPEIARRSEDSGKRWLAAFVITAVFSAIEIRQSFILGTLALPTTYDGISYYVESATLLRTLYDSGLSGLVKNYLSYQPNSPLSTALAFFGFAVLGIKAWVGPVVDGIVLFFFVRAFLAVSIGLPIGQAMLLSVALLGFPLMGLTLMDYRPDMICSLLVAVGTLFIILRPGWLHQVRDQGIAGLLFGAALWAKPHVFPVTGTLFGVAMLLGSLEALRARNYGTVATAIATTGGIGILVSLPYYAFAVPRVVTYIWTVAFGSRSAIWNQPMPLSDHVLFYLTALMGRQSLGLWLYVGAALGIVTLLVLWRAGDRLFGRAALVCLMVVISYLAVTVPSFKGPHGLIFAATFLAAVALAVIALVKRLPSAVGWGFCCALLFFSTWQFEWPSKISGLSTTVAAAGFAESRWKMVDEAVEAIGQETEGKTLYQATPTVYLNENILKFEYLSRGLTPPYIDESLSADLSVHRKSIDHADFALVPSPDSPDVFSILPTAPRKFRAQIIGLIEKSGRFEPPIRIADPLRGGAILIYKTLPAFGTFQHIEGMAPIGGPYPQWNLPRVRWGSGAQSTLVAEGTPNSHAVLVIEGRGRTDISQTLTVVVDGKTKLSAPVPASFTNFNVPIDFDQTGLAEISLRYGIPADNAVLFRVLAVRPDPRK